MIERSICIITVSISIFVSFNTTSFSHPVFFHEVSKNEGYSISGIAFAAI